MASQEPNIGLNYGWEEGESGWALQMDENLRALGALLHLEVLSRTVEDPSDLAPENGDRYIVPDGASGDWDGLDGKIVRYMDDTWEVHTPKAGWRCVVVDEGPNGVMIRYDGSAWEGLPMEASGLADGTIGIAKLEEFAQDHAITSGLTFGHRGGIIRSDNSITTVSSGTLSLTDDATNYIEADGNGAVSVNTDGFTSGSIPLFEITTESGEILSVSDRRAWLSNSKVPAHASETETHGVPSGERLAHTGDLAIRDEINAIRESATLNLNFAKGKYALDDGERTETTTATDLLTVNRASPKWVEGPSGRLREVPIDTVARQWRNGVPQGVLIEESRTNLLLWSEDFTNSGWNKRDVSVESSSTISPVGSSTSYKLVENSDDSDHRIYQGSQNVPSQGDTLTCSVFIKAAERRYILLRFIDGGGSYRGASFDLEDIEVGEVDSGYEANIERMSDDWVRVSLTHTFDEEVTSGIAGRININLALANTLSSSDHIYSGDGSSGVYIWGAQLEEGSLSSYIPTEDSTVTRAADEVSRDLGDEFNQSGFSVYSDFYFSETRLNGNRYHPHLESDSNRISLRFANDNEGGYALQIVEDGSVVINKSVTNLDDESVNKVAFSVEEGQAIVVVNGVTTTFSVSNYPEVKTLTIGDQGREGRTNTTFGIYKIFPNALAEDELKELTK